MQALKHKHDEVHGEGGNLLEVLHIFKPDSRMNIDASGQRNRINELLLMVIEKGFDIPEKAIKHCSNEKDEIEYVLVRF